MDLALTARPFDNLHPALKVFAMLLVVALLATGFALAVDTDRADALSRTGSTIWLNKWDVAAAAAGGTAAVVGMLMSSFGISASAAWNMVGVVIGVFWSAVYWGRCAWVTFSPWSAGTYSC